MIAQTVNEMLEKLSELYTDDWMDEFTRALNGVPEYMHEPLLAYLLYGRPVGSFLEKVLSNDLQGAVLYADDNNIKALPQWVHVVRCLPIGCAGSHGVVKNWIKQGGLLRVKSHWSN